MRPSDVICPRCDAPKGERCWEPGFGGLKKELDYHHAARVDLAMERLCRKLKKAGVDL